MLNKVNPGDGLEWLEKNRVLWKLCPEKVRSELT
jgi:hypothetical protein